jgi:hypothetical protein
LFTWRRLLAQGGLTAAGSGEEVVPASDCRALQNQVRELHRLLGKKTLEAENGADEAGSIVFRKRLRRSSVLQFFALQPQCTVAMEACAGSAQAETDQNCHPCWPLEARPLCCKLPLNTPNIGSRSWGNDTTISFLGVARSSRP